MSYFVRPRHNVFNLKESVNSSGNEHSRHSVSICLMNNLKFIQVKSNIH